MTTFCRIVFTVVSCTIDPATPVPTPADAGGDLQCQQSAVSGHALDRAVAVVLTTCRSADDGDWPYTSFFATPNADSDLGGDLSPPRRDVAMGSPDNLRARSACPPKLVRPIE